MKIAHLSFTNVYFEQTDPDALTFRIKNVELTEAITFTNCTFTSTHEVSYAASFAMIETKQLWDLDLKKFAGEIVFDGLKFCQPNDAYEWDVLTLEMLRTANVVIKNTNLSKNSLFAFYRAYNISITDSTFESSGATFVTSSMIELSSLNVTGRPMADWLQANTQVFFVFYESYPNLPGSTALFKNVKFENITKNLNTSLALLDGGLIYIPTTQTSVFSSFNVACSFNNISRGIYAIKNVDDHQSINARSNWWGSPLGPDDYCNKHTHGAEIYWNRNTEEGHVKFSPWCSTANCSERRQLRWWSVCFTESGWFATVIGCAVGIPIAAAGIGVGIYLAASHFREKLRSADHQLETVQAELATAETFRRVAYKPRAAVEQMSPMDIGAFCVPFASFTGGLSVLALGGRSEVRQTSLDPYFLVMHPHLQSQHLVDVVIKLPRLLDDDGIELSGSQIDANRKSLRWELYLLQSFNNVDFPLLIGFTEINSEYGIVMLKMSPLEINPKRSEEDALQTTMLAARALGSLHSHRIIHGDVKPNNLLLSDLMGEHVVISDLGDSHVLPNDVDFLPAQYFGTRNYGCPHYKESRQVTMAADVYSFGKTIFAIFTGKQPKSKYFQEATLGDNSTLELTSKAPSSVPVPIQRIISQCLQRDPAARPLIAEVVRSLALLNSPTEPVAESLSADYHLLPSPDADASRPLLPGAIRSVQYASSSGAHSNPQPVSGSRSNFQPDIGVSLDDLADSIGGFDRPSSSTK